MLKKILIQFPCVDILNLFLYKQNKKLLTYQCPFVFSFNNKTLAIKKLQVHEIVLHS